MYLERQVAIFFELLLKFRALRSFALDYGRCPKFWAPLLKHTFLPHTGDETSISCTWNMCLEQATLVVYSNYLQPSKFLVHFGILVNFWYRMSPYKCRKFAYKCRKFARKCRKFPVFPVCWIFSFLLTSLQPILPSESQRNSRLKQNG